jgi:hypothetical protein
MVTPLITYATVVPYKAVMGTFALTHRPSLRRAGGQSPMESAAGASHALVVEGEGIRSALVIQECFNRLADQHAPSPDATFHAWLVKHASIIYVKEVLGRIQWQLTHASCANDPDRHSREVKL